MVLHISRETPARTKRALFPGFFLLFRTEETRRHFARAGHSALLFLSLSRLASSLLLLSLVFERIRADAHSKRTPLTPVSATQGMRGAPDVPAPRAQSTSNAYPRIHMRTCLMQMSFLPASLLKEAPRATAFIKVISFVRRAFQYSQRVAFALLCEYRHVVVAWKVT